MLCNIRSWLFWEEERRSFKHTKIFSIILLLLSACYLTLFKYNFFCSHALHTRGETMKKRWSPVKIFCDTGSRCFVTWSLYWFLDVKKHFFQKQELIRWKSKDFNNRRFSAETKEVIVGQCQAAITISIGIYNRSSYLDHFEEIFSRDFL